VLIWDIKLLWANGKIGRIRKVRNLVCDAAHLLISCSQGRGSDKITSDESIGYAI